MFQNCLTYKEAEKFEGKDNEQIPDKEEKGNYQRFKISHHNHEQCGKEKILELHEKTENLSREMKIHKDKRKFKKF